MIKRILIGFGHSSTVPAEIQHAVELAQFHGAEVTALTPVDVEQASSAKSPSAEPLSAAGWARELAHERRDIVCEETAAALRSFWEKLA